MAENSNRFILLYGSQTGQAKAIAEQICEKCLLAGYSPDIQCISGSDKTFNLLDERIVVIVVSTTGDGEPPDTVNKFWRKIKKRTNPPDMLKNIKYSLLGLGDSNYTNFCNMGKILNEKMLQLGAVPFHESGYADDGVGLEIVVEPWIASLIPAVGSVLASNSTPTVSGDDGSNDCNAPPETTTSRSSTIEASSIPDISPLSLTESSLNSSYTFTDFELSLRGDDDGYWQSSPFRVSPYPSSYIDCNLVKTMSLSPFDYSIGSAMSQRAVAMASVVNRTILTSPDAQKTTLELKLSWKEDCIKYQPGDALCVICPNNSREVNYLIERLNLVQEQDYCMGLSISKETTKRNPIIPKHIPSLCTVLQYFKHCADIRGVLKKATLLGLSQYCVNDADRTRLQWLSSREGSSDYNKYILETHLDIIDILHAFPLCTPPLSRLIEFLPRLQPRYYSVASSPLVSANQETNIVFNITQLPNRTWQQEKRRGLCSGWLADLSLQVPTDHVVPLFERLDNPFSLPPDKSLPVIMIGPGTGIAPFMGFLEHRLALLKAADTLPIGSSWLFFGCRHPDRDYLYKEQLDFFASPAGRNVLTHFNVSYSRLEDSHRNEHEFTKYVQDSLRKHKDKLSKWIMEDKAVVFVCGDAKSMATNIKDAMTDVIQYYIESKDCAHVNARDVIQELIEDKRYKVDQWI